MPRMGNGRVSEKSKDFKGAVINLLKDMKSWHLWLLVAIILAFASSILALIAPDKLSGLTDIITEGINYDGNIGGFPLALAGYRLHAEAESG